MDFETSFEEFVEDKRFIALEVSDNDDDCDTDLTADTADELESSAILKMRESNASLNVTTGNNTSRKTTSNSKNDGLYYPIILLFHHLNLRKDGLYFLQALPVNLIRTGNRGTFCNKKKILAELFKLRYGSI